MTVIQPILLLLLLCGALVYFTRFRSRLGDRTVVIVLLLGASVLVALPELTTRLAHRVGVGRGADLIIYLALLGYGFIVLVLISKIRSLETSIVDLARAIALAHARVPAANRNSAEHGTLAGE
jgi:hypothetical protein